MRLVLEKRAERSDRMALLSPVIAILLTLITGGVIFAMRGLDPLAALYVYFVEPLSTSWSIEQLIVKATPLASVPKASSPPAPFSAPQSRSFSPRCRRR